jgi:SAM-dependent methyltransferase
MTRRSIAQTSLDWLNVFGINLGVTKASIKALPRYLRDGRAFKTAMRASGADMPLGRAYPVLLDYKDSAGAARGHYFHMDLWAARKIFKAAPKHHVDIGSRIDGFVAHLLTFRDVEVVDIRPLSSNVTGLRFVQADATTLDGVPNGAWESISTLHAAEHFGLGRYGDPIDPFGYYKFIQVLTRVLAPGGRLYFATPIGRERIEFNAHRIFDPLRIVREFSPLELVSFAAVNDDGTLSEPSDPMNHRNADQACGLYEFTKR